MLLARYWEPSRVRLFYGGTGDGPGGGVGSGGPGAGGASGTSGGGSGSGSGNGSGGGGDGNRGHHGIDGDGRDGKNASTGSAASGGNNRSDPNRSDARAAARDRADRATSANNGLSRGAVEKQIENIMRENVVPFIGFTIDAFASPVSTLARTFGITNPLSESVHPGMHTQAEIDSFNDRNQRNEAVSLLNTMVQLAVTLPIAPFAIATALSVNAAKKAADFFGINSPALDGLAVSSDSYLGFKTANFVGVAKTFKDFAKTDRNNSVADPSPGRGDGPARYAGGAAGRGGGGGGGLELSDGGAGGGAAITRARGDTRAAPITRPPPANHAGILDALAFDGKDSAGRVIIPGGDDDAKGGGLLPVILAAGAAVAVLN